MALKRALGRDAKISGGRRLGANAVCDTASDGSLFVTRPATDPFVTNPPRSPSDRPQIDSEAGDPDPEPAEPATHDATQAPPEAEGKREFGTVVPYAGDDETEEVEPVSLDAPFLRDESPAKTISRYPAVAPGVATTKKTGSEPPADGPAAPAAERLLESLFDSSPPPPTSEAPQVEAPSEPEPSVAHEAASRPYGSGAFGPPTDAQPADREALPTAGEPEAGTQQWPTPALVAIPSINVTASPPAVKMPLPAEREPTPVPEPMPVPELGSTDPTVTPVGPGPLIGEEPEETLEWHPSLGELGGVGRVSAEDLNSEVATERPPAVAAPVSKPAIGVEPGPAATVVASLPPSSHKDTHLPSVMLAPDVEGDLEKPLRPPRAPRSSKATVRIELPPDFAQRLAPGTPMARTAVDSFYPPSATARTPSISKKTWLWLLAGGVLLVAALLVRYLGQPNTGSLVVAARGPGNRPVPGVQIYVDGQPLCDASPCQIAGLEPGKHGVRVTGTGLEPLEEHWVDVVAGEEAVANVELTREKLANVGGLRVTAGATPMTLFVDGKRVGKLPQTVSGLSQGKHWIKLEPDDPTRAESIEKAVIVEPGKTLEVAPTVGQSQKVLVTIVLDAASEGASVSLDGAFLLDFPAELELDPSVSHTLTASKPDFEDFEMTIELDSGERATTVEVSLSPLNVDKPRRRSQARRRRAARRSANRGAESAATQGLLNISSIPPSQIILNGRPLGTSPKQAVAVPGDSLQTIVFVHPEMGRRRAQKFVPAGEKRNVAIRF